MLTLTRKVTGIPQENMDKNFVEIYDSETGASFRVAVLAVFLGKAKLGFEDSSGRFKFTRSELILGESHE